MPKNIAVIGAGGKMGRRAMEKIGAHSEYQVLACEQEPEKSEKLMASGFTVTPLPAALAAADYVVLAVPDAAIGKVSHTAVPLMKPGSTLIMLDAAAAYIGDLPHRESITQMIAHPCHPALFEEQPSHKTRDFFGGRASQDIVVSLIEGERDSFEYGTTLSKSIFAPVGTAHEVTPEQFALLEPAMSELIVATAATLMKQSLDKVVAMGVPRDAAWAFMSGHAQIAIAMVFGFEPSPLSDAAKIAVDWGMKEVIRSDWEKVFERKTLEEAIRFMLHPAN